jgi:hypothetical protein
LLRVCGRDTIGAGTVEEDEGATGVEEVTAGVDEIDTIGAEDEADVDPASRMGDAMLGDAAGEDPVSGAGEGGPSAGAGPSPRTGETGGVNAASGLDAGAATCPGADTTNPGAGAANPGAGVLDGAAAEECIAWSMQ